MNSRVTAKQVLFYLTKVTKPFTSSILVMFVVAIIIAVDVSFRPYLLKIILDRLTIVTQPKIFHYLLPPILIYLGAYILKIIAYRTHDYFVEIKMFPNLRKKIANESFELLLNKSHIFYQNNLAGTLADKINILVYSVPDIIRLLIEEIFTYIMILIVAIITLWLVNIKFAIFISVFSIVIIIGIFTFSKRLGPLADTWSGLGTIITGKIVDALSNILSIRLFSAKNYEKKVLNRTYRKAVKAEQKLQWTYVWMFSYFDFLFSLFMSLNFYFLCKGRQAGWITVGDFVLVLSLNFAIMDYIWYLARDFYHFSRLFGQITQAIRTIINSPVFLDKPDATILKINQGKIVFDQVEFYYRNTEPIFQNRSIVIKPKQKLGLVGYSGSGKTTLVNLILRLYDVIAGRILIDDQDIRDVTQESLHRNIAMIPQDLSLFHRTIMENIRYGKITATDNEVIKAAKSAHAHEFIMQLPQQYHTLVGERGTKLSGGQRQRINIARAFLKNASILILDEATSQLDSITESYIQKSLTNLMRNKTVIVVAHRLSTLTQMDRILVFDHGKIIQDGTHAELIRKKGLYKKIWNAQVGGLLL